MRLIPLAAALTVITLATASAQSTPHPQTRSGFTIALGFGIGSEKVSCEGCTNTDSETGGTGFLRIGGAVRPNLVLSGRADAWMKEAEGEKLTLSTVAFAAQWYPLIHYGWYVEGGIGGGASRIDDDSGDVLETAGPALVIGTGYDVRIGRNFSLTPYLNISSIARAPLKLNGNEITGPLASERGFTFVQIGFGFTWH